MLTVLYVILEHSKWNDAAFLFDARNVRLENLLAGRICVEVARRNDRVDQALIDPGTPVCKPIPHWRSNALTGQRRADLDVRIDLMHRLTQVSEELRKVITPQPVPV